jgi:MFS family permease
MLDAERSWGKTTADVAFKNAHLPSWRRRYLLATFFGAAGRNTYFVGASWGLLDSTRQAGSIAVFLILGCVVEFLSSKPAGHIADHVDRRLLCALCDFARLLIMLGVSGGLLLGWSDYVLYTSVAVYSIIDRIYLTAMPAIIPSLVGGGRLLRFNALSYTGMQAGNMVAAAVAGVLLNVSPGAICFLFAAAAFLLSLITMAAVGKSNKVLAPLPPGRPRAGLCEPPTEHWPRLPLTLVVAYALTYTMGMLISTLASVFVLQELNGNAVHFGLLEAGWALGAIVGAVLLTMRTFKGVSDRAIPPIVAFLGVVLAALFLTRRMDLCVVQILLLGAGYNIARVLVEAELQRMTPSARLGRAKGALHLVCTGFGLLLYLALAVVGKSLLPSTLFLIYGAAMILCAIIPFVVAIRRKFTTGGVWLT